MHIHIPPYIKKKTTATAIFIFAVLFYLINTFKPKFLYKTDGTMREFGIGTKQKTFLPVWTLAIVLAMLSYLFALSLKHYY